MTKEEWDSKQNASKKQFKYMPTGTPGKVKKVEVTDEEEENEEKGKEAVIEKVKSLSPANNTSELENEALRQAPQLSEQLKKSLELQEAGQEGQIGGKTGGNLAAGLSYAMDDIEKKIKDKGLNSEAAIIANKEFLLSDPKTRSLITHPVFMQKFPDFWQKISQKSGVKLT